MSSLQKFSPPLGGVEDVPALSEERGFTNAFF